MHITLRHQQRRNDNNNSNNNRDHNDDDGGDDDNSFKDLTEILSQRNDNIRRHGVNTTTTNY